MPLISIAWFICIVQNKTLYPRWMELFSPIDILTLLFGMYHVLPGLGVWLLPAAMNVTHVIVFGMSVIILVTRR